MEQEKNSKQQTKKTYKSNRFKTKIAYIPYKKSSDDLKELNAYSCFIQESKEVRKGKKNGKPYFELEHSTHQKTIVIGQQLEKFVVNVFRDNKLTDNLFFDTLKEAKKHFEQLKNDTEKHFIPTEEDLKYYHSSNNNSNFE